MDAKERLRLYLEQRRELGESELVLDALPVDDVLRMIGLPSSKLSATTKTSNELPAPNTIPSLANVASDEALPTDTVGVVHSPESSTPAITPASPPASTSVSSPPENPPARFDEATAVDWRSALRNADKTNATNARPTDLSSPTRSSDPASDVGSAAKPATGAASNTVLSNYTLPSWLLALNIPAGLSAAPSIDTPTDDAVRNCDSLEDLARTISACRACSLGESATHSVPGEGNPDADFVCVGEAPGQSEDETGRPFVGPAGQLLTKILSAIQLQREDVFICNVLKHRPPGNRNPLPTEVTACTPYLTRQLGLVKPKVILALGTFAAQTLLNTQISLGKLRGMVHCYQNIPLIVTYHPAALLRNESWKRPAWDDVRLARRILDAARAQSSSTN